MMAEYDLGPFIVTFCMFAGIVIHHKRKKNIKLILDQRFGIKFYYEKILPGTGRQIVVVLVLLPLVYEQWDSLKLNLTIEILARGEMTT